MQSADAGVAPESLISRCRHTHIAVAYFKLPNGTYGWKVVMLTVNWLTENFRLTGLLINRTETGNMATSLSDCISKKIFNFCTVKK